MRSSTWARWATCALAISICVPALAGKAKKSLADCTSFDQADKGDDAVELTIHNTCTVPVACSISWKLICAPDSHKRHSEHAGSAKLSLVEGNTQSTTASAELCGDAGWQIDSIQWGCEPAKD